jgi:hypothetical protein
VKKAIQVGTLAEIKTILDTENGILLFSNMGGEIHVQDIDVFPRERFKVDFDGQVLTLKITVKEGEFVAVKDVKGRLVKMSLKELKKLWSV